MRGTTMHFYQHTGLDPRRMFITTYATQRGTDGAHERAVWLALGYRTDDIYLPGAIERLEHAQSLGLSVYGAALPRLTPDALQARAGYLWRRRRQIPTDVRDALMNASDLPEFWRAIDAGEQHLRILPALAG